MSGDAPFRFGEEPQLARDGVAGLGRKMAGGGGKVARRANDYYPTPPEATEALLRAEHEYLLAHDGPVWEPCGRGGAIARVLTRHGFSVVSSDIVADPAHFCDPLDLLTANFARGDVVITNPPFALAAPMIGHLLGALDVSYLAMLLKTTFWSAASRGWLLARWPVARRYDLTWRLDFMDAGNPVMECSWFVWDRRAVLTGQWDILSREAPAPMLFREGVML